MIRTLHFKLLLLGCLILAALHMNAQGWEKKYAITTPYAGMDVNGIYPSPEGSYLITGWDYSASTHHQTIMRINANGDVLWQKFVDTAYMFTQSQITSDRGLIICNERTIIRVDSSGNKLWSRVLFPNRSAGYNGSGSTGNSAIDTTDDHGFIIAYTAYDTTISLHPHLFLDRLDSAGNVIWDHSYFSNDTIPVAWSVINSKDGGFIASQAEYNRTGSMVFKLDNSGTLLWKDSDAVNIYSNISISKDNNVLIVGNDIYTKQNKISKYNQAGQLLWANTYPVLPDSGLWFYHAYERSNGTLALIDQPLFTNSYNGSFSLSFVDSLGHLLYYKTIQTNQLGQGVLFSTYDKSVMATPDGGYMLGGAIRWRGNNTDTGISKTSFLIKTDSNGIVYPSVLSGTVFQDSNNNCIKDSAEIFMSPVYLNITNGGDSFMIATGLGGYFSVELINGNYTIQPTPPSPYWQPSSCNPTAGTIAYGADSSITLGLEPIVAGPYIVINGHMSRQVGCREAVYTAQYCNYGTATFAGYIDITVDTLLHVDSTSRPWASQAGSVYTFLSDTLGPMACGSINIYYSVPCGPAYSHRSTCIDAQAYQDTILNPSPLWDRSVLKMSVSYDQASDSITFILKNTGGGGMSVPEGMIVIEDNVILGITNMQLTAGAQSVYKVKANGSTWRATINQTPNNPYSKFTTAAIEGAGIDSSGGVSTGYFTQYPYNGYTSYQYNTCAEIYNSYDPNGKYATPKGAGPDQLIDTNTVMEYTIDFQNTGNATAYLVSVTDTLAPFLDPMSLRLEMSSSPCQIVMLNSHTVSFVFTNIQLPDSSAGQLQSSGFVKFRINQRAGNAGGTVINNTANVYFDYNMPVTTNTATVRIGQVLLTGIQNIYAGKAIQISAYPNPFLANTTIKIGGENFADLALDIYDLNGQLIKHQENKNSNSFTIDRNAINTGDYIFKINSNGKPVGNGKIIAQ